MLFWDTMTRKSPIIQSKKSREKCIDSKTIFTRSKKHLLMMLESLMNNNASSYFK